MEQGKGGCSPRSHHAPRFASSPPRSPPPRHIASSPRSLSLGSIRCHWVQLPRWPRPAFAGSILLPLGSWICDMVARSWALLGGTCFDRWSLLGVCICGGRYVSSMDIGPTRRCWVVCVVHRVSWPSSIVGWCGLGAGSAFVCVDVLVIGFWVALVVTSPARLNALALVSTPSRSS